MVVLPAKILFYLMFTRAVGSAAGRVFVIKGIV